MVLVCWVLFVWCVFTVMTVTVTNCVSFFLGLLWFAVAGTTLQRWGLLTFSNAGHLPPMESAVGRLSPGFRQWLFPRSVVGRMSLRDWDLSSKEMVETREGRIGWVRRLLMRVNRRKWISLIDVLWRRRKWRRNRRRSRWFVRCVEISTRRRWRRWTRTSTVALCGRWGRSGSGCGGWSWTRRRSDPSRRFLSWRRTWRRRSGSRRSRRCWSSCRWTPARFRALSRSSGGSRSGSRRWDPTEFPSNRWNPSERTRIPRGRRNRRCCVLFVGFSTPRRWRRRTRTSTVVSWRL